MNNLVVYKSNKVIEAGYRLTLNEQRVILACIAQINSAHKLLVTDRFELSAKDFALLFSISEERAYHALIDVSESLFNRYVVIHNPFPNDPSITQLKTHWISSISYKPHLGRIVLCFAQDMLPYLSELKNQFTKYELQYIGNMTSIYAIRLYELLMQWKSTGTRTVEIEWLKQQFQIEGQYKAMKDLKKYVIDPAVKDINTHSDFEVSWTQKKTGRRVTHFIFTFRLKKTAEADKKPKAIKDSAQEALITKLMSIGYSLKVAQRDVKKYGDEYIERNIEYTLAKHKMGEVKNIPAYLKKALAEDWGGAWAAAIAAQKQQAQEKEILQQKQQQEEKNQQERLIAVFYALPTEKMKSLGNEFADWLDRYADMVSPVIFRDHMKNESPIADSQIKAHLAKFLAAKGF